MITQELVEILVAVYTSLCPTPKRFWVKKKFDLGEKKYVSFTI
jgi:hypothetical protein